MVGFGEEALHLAAELVGEVVVLLFKDRVADIGEMVFGVAIVAVARLTGP